LEVNLASPTVKKTAKGIPVLQTRDEVRILSELNFITASSFMNRILSVATHSLVLRPPPCRNDPREDHGKNHNADKKL
jgi:hypothetical protein